jgi:hypothetical protein
VAHHHGVTETTKFTKPFFLVVLSGPSCLRDVAARVGAGLQIRVLQD